MVVVTPGDGSFHKRSQTDCGLHVRQLQWVVSFVADVGRINPADESAAARAFERRKGRWKGASGIEGRSLLRVQLDDCE